MDENCKKFSKKRQTKRWREIIKPSALAEEILPLMEEYFQGHFLNLENVIMCSFPNRQKFRISIDRCE